MAELLPISSPLAAERQLDVVFVHGLGGDPIETWRSGTDQNTSWPHWLALEFGTQIGVWSLGYAAAPSKWQGIPFFAGKDPDAGAAMSLPRRAENALDRLVGAGIGQRSLCFITHSLGGLLVKSILRRSADSQFAPDRLQVVEQCRGVLFLATPHHGSRLADLAGAIKVYLPSVSTLDLKDNDDHLMDLYEWYRSYAPSHHILTRSYYENKETKGVVIVVPRSSADPGDAGDTARGPTPLDRDHLEISKPRNRQDQAYIGSTQLIRLILSGGAPAAGPGQPPVASAPGVTASPSSAQPPPSPQPLPAQPAYTTPVQAPQTAATNQVKVSGNRNITMTGVSAGGNINMGNSIQGDYVAGDKFTGDKVMGNIITGNKIINTLASPSDGPATTPGASPLKPGPWRVFLSHTSELRQYPQAGSYIAKAERAVSAAGHAIVDMADFPAIDQAPAAVCEQRVRNCDVLVGIYGLRYGSPVRDQPEVSYTELEFITATEAAVPRLIFLINADSEELGLPAKALVDRDYGDRQDAFIQRVKDAGLTLQFFRNPDDLKGLVERSLRELAESATVVADAQQAAVVARSLRWSWPQPLDFGPYRTFRRQGFVGRSWLFEEVRTWAMAEGAAAGRPRAQLIEAEYGVGKSAFLAELVDTQAAGVPVVAQHFCQFDAIATLAPGRFVSSIAAQLAAALPAYRAAIEAEAAAGLRQLLEAPDNDPIGAFDQAVLAPLEAMAPPAGPLLLVVDALDEALEHRPSNEKAARVTIVSLLGQRAQRFPRWLRLLATARPLPAVQQPLRQAFVLTSLNAEEARNLADLEAYAEARCQQPPLAALLAAAGLNASEVAIRLRTLSGGKFLYAAFVLNELASEALPLRDRADLEALPAGMDDFYLQAFERRFPSEQAYDQVRELLAVHCVQRDPLSRRELAAILNWPEARLVDLQAQQLHDLLRLRRNDPAYGPKEFLASFNHPSLSRWLTATDEHSGYPRADRFSIDPEAAEAAIRRWALAELEAQRAHTWPYLVRHLASHLSQAERPALLAGLLGQFAWLEARLRLAGINALLGDFALAAPAPWLGRLGRALGQGAHCIWRLTPRCSGTASASWFSPSSATGGPFHCSGRRSSIPAPVSALRW